jgi:Flp pilus assembly pilin Flp
MGSGVNDGWVRALGRFHRDQRGWTMLDYAMVFAFVAIPLVLLFDKMFQIISMYFAMIAYYITWPFL